MKVKLVRFEFLEFSKVINAIIEPKDESWKVQFKNAMAKTKRLLKIDLECLSESLIDKCKKIEKAREKLDIECCEIREGHDIDKEGITALEPLLDENDKQPRFMVFFQIVYFQMYKLIQEFTDEDYEAKFNIIVEENRETMDELQKFMMEDITINVHSVKCEYLPSLIQKEHDLISYMVED